MKRLVKLLTRKGFLLAIVLSIACYISDSVAQDAADAHAYASACEYGDLQKLTAMLEQDANPNRTYGNNQTCLQAASRGRYTAVMKLLLEKGANPNVKNKLGQTPLFEAVATRNIEGAKLLIKAGARPDSFSLVQAARLDQLEIVQLLVNAGAKPEVGALLAAAQDGSVNVLRAFSEQGMNLAVVSKDETTPLHLAALQGGVETVRFLLDKGADPNRANVQGETSLHKAISGDCDLNILKLLIAKGGRLDLSDNNGVTPVRSAAQLCSGPTYQWLLNQTGGSEPRGVRPKSIASDNRSTVELLNTLSSKYPQPQQAEQLELVLRGSAVVPEIFQAVDKGAKIEAFYDLLTAMGPEALTALPRLEKQLANKTTVVPTAIVIERIEPGALQKLSEQTKVSAASALYDATLSGGEGETWFAPVFLLQLGEPAAPWILRFLRSDDANIRAGIARLIGEEKTSFAAVTKELLRISQSDPNETVRSSASTALVALGESVDQAKSSLLSVFMTPGPTTDKNQADRELDPAVQEAIRGIVALGPSVIEDLIPMLTPLDRPGRIQAIDTLAQLGEAAVPRIIQLLGHDDSAIAVSASVILNRIGHRAVPSLVGALQNTDERVVDHAANALWWIGTATDDSLAEILKVAASEKRSDTVRLAVGRAAFKINAVKARSSEVIPSLIPVLIRKLESGSFQHQGWAAETLGRIGSQAKSALPALKKRLVLPPESEDTGGLVRDFVQREAQQAIKLIESSSESMDS